MALDDCWCSAQAGERATLSSRQQEMKSYCILNPGRWLSMGFWWFFRKTTVWLSQVCITVWSPRLEFCLYRWIDSAVMDWRPVTSNWMEMYSAEAAHSFALNVSPYILMFPPCFFLSRCGRCQPAAPTSNTHQLFQFRPTLTPKFHELPSINKSLLLSSFASFEALHCVHRKLTFILVGNWAKKKKRHNVFTSKLFFSPCLCLKKLESLQARSLPRHPLPSAGDVGTSLSPRGPSIHFVGVTLWTLHIKAFVRCQREGALWRLIHSLTLFFPFSARRQFNTASLQCKLNCNRADRHRHFLMRKRSSFG